MRSLAECWKLLGPPHRTPFVASLKTVSCQKKKISTPSSFHSWLDEENLKPLAACQPVSSCSLCTSYHGGGGACDDDVLSTTTSPGQQLFLLLFTVIHFSLSFCFVLFNTFYIGNISFYLSLFVFFTKALLNASLYFQRVYKPSVVVWSSSWRTWNSACKYMCLTCGKLTCSVIFWRGNRTKVFITAN